jgi:NitT/TauT family transport system substrate-binding protein
MTIIGSIARSAATAVVAAVLAVGFSLGGSAPTAAQEKVVVAIISVSVYGPWYIVKERNLAQGIDLDIKIIEDLTARNAGLSTGDIQCMMTTMDSTVVTVAAGVPVKHIAVPLMSYGLDQMVVQENVRSIEDFPGKSYAADYGFLNHMWMLLTLKKAGIPFDAVEHKIMIPQDATAAFVSGALDIDVNFLPFSTQSLQRPGSYLFKTSLTDKTWERGLISDSIACNAEWMENKPAVAKELLRSWFEAVNWWKENPEEGNEIIARGLDWPIEDVALTQHGTIMLNIDQNMGAFGLGDGKPVCESVPSDAPAPPAEPSGWGKLFGGKDCEAGYLRATWDIFAQVYHEAGVIERTPTVAEGLDDSLVKALWQEGYRDKYNSNEWIGRVWKE